MNDVKENRNGSTDPENHSDSDERVRPEGEAIVTFGRREQNVVDRDFSKVRKNLFSVTRKDKKKKICY